MSRIMWLLVAAGLGLALNAAHGIADGPQGCREAQLVDPPRTVFECAGLIVEAEAADALGFENAPDPAGPRAISVERGGVFVGRGPSAEPFQILTPHAIAAVRGTTFVVDVEDDQTAVLVLDGAVAVARLPSDEEALLTGGEGIDVAEGEPLTVREWPQDRVAQLLARFGR